MQTILSLIGLCLSKLTINYTLLAWLVIPWRDLKKNFSTQIEVSINLSNLPAHHVNYHMKFTDILEK